MLVNLEAVLRRAKAEHYAVGLFNTIDTMQLEAAIAAAEETRSPIIIGTAEVLTPFGDLPLIAPGIIAAAKRASVPVVVHYDHGLTFEKTMEALRLGFTSVMFDASTKEYAENIAETREVVKIAHAMGATVEGEIGHVGVAAAGDNDKEVLYTTVEEAVDFQTKTGVDALAVAVGNAHGVYKTKPCIQLKRIEELSAAVSAPLVLHGGSGLSDEDFLNAIQRGIAKVNIFTDMCLAGNAAMKAGLAAEEQYYEIRNRAMAAVKECVINKMRLFGCAGKA